jgi:hypothetical protein
MYIRKVEHLEEVSGMAIRIVKNAGATAPDRQPARPTLQPNSPRLNATKPPSPRKTKSRAPLIAVAIVAIIGIILLLCLLPSQQPPARQTSQATAQVRPANTPKPYVPRRPAELGGLTMAEWERKNNTNNVMLEDRKERMRNYGSGQ